MKTLPIKTENILLRVDTKFKQRLVKAATRAGCTLSDYIRMAIEEKIASGT